jgi:hypothetical protein
MSGGTIDGVPTDEVIARLPPHVWAWLRADHRPPPAEPPEEWSCVVWYGEPMTRLDPHCHCGPRVRAIRVWGDAEADKVAAAWGKRARAGESVMVI